MRKCKAKLKSLFKRIVRLTKEKVYIPIPQPINTQQILIGKVALITGGSGGIGFEIAHSFINNGCKVILCGTNEKKLQENAEKLGNNAKWIKLDVLHIDQMSDKINEAAQMFDENRIDILVNSAGVVDHLPFLNVTEEEYDSIMQINAKGTFFMGQTMGSYMIEHGIKGHILNVSSSSALRPAWTPYQMSKWAIRGLTLGMADALLPYGIIVNAIAPGPVATPMLNVKEGDSIYRANQPSGRYSMPCEIAYLATFMVSDMGNLIVGDTFYMTGGSGTIDLRH